MSEFIGVNVLSCFKGLDPNKESKFMRYDWNYFVFTVFRYF